MMTVECVKCELFQAPVADRHNVYRYSFRQEGEKEVIFCVDMDEQKFIVGNKYELSLQDAQAKPQAND